MESGTLLNGKAILLSTNQYTKDGDITVHTAAEAGANAMRQSIEQQLLGGFNPAHTVWLHNEPDIIKIKEQIALAAEQAQDLLLIYIAGTAVLRRGQIYLTLPYSTLAQIHVNGLSVQELADIIREPETAHKIFILDCYFSGETPDLTQAVREELHRHAAKLKKSFLMAQLWQTGYETLGQQISCILREGIIKQQPTLSLEDLCQELNEIAHRQRRPEAVMAAKKQTLGIAVAANRRFKEFERLLNEGKQAFEERNFDLALNYFVQAQGLYANDDETATHIRFIHRLQEAEQAYAQKQYIPARRAYEAAFELIPATFLPEKIERCTADLANHYFELQQYEQAKAAYARLASEHPNDAFYAERLQISSTEHRYNELIDKADNHYFRYEFVEALEAYREALTIHSDTKTERRAQECQRYVDVLLYLQEKAETEVRTRIEAELQQKADAALAERMAQLQKELTARIEQETAQKMEQHYNALVWDAALQSNQRAAVELYLTLFPKGAFVDQAHYWLSLHQEPADRPAAAPAVAEVSQPTVEPYSPAVDLPAEPQPVVAATVEKTAIETADTKPAAETFTDEAALWSAALARDTIEGYMEYISKTTEAEHIADAYYRISRIRNAANTASQETTAKQTEPALTANGTYEEKPLNPTEPTYQTAAPTSAELLEEQLWQQATAANTSQAYQDYLNRSALLKYAGQARQLIEELQEKERMEETLAWEKASAEDTLEAYKAYISKYPFGNFYAKARFRIARLESEIN